MNQIQLTPAQQAALSLSQHIVVTAGAGTGKTEVLIQRIIKILSQVNHINQVLAITYTDKAAGEIKHRVYRAILEKMNTAQGDERAKFERMREQFLKNYISTIHSFCAAIIRRFPQEIDGLDPDFGILEGYEQRKLLRESIETLLDSIATNKEHQLYDDLRNVLRHRSKGIVMSMLEELVNRRQEIGAGVSYNPRGQGGKGAREQESNPLALLPSCPSPWIEMVNTLTESEILRRQEQLASSYSQNLLNKLKEMPQIRNILSRLERYTPEKSAEKDNAYTKRQIVLNAFVAQDSILAGECQIRNLGYNPVLDAFEGNPSCKGGKNSPKELVEELFDSQGNVRGFGRLGSQTVWGKETIGVLRNDFEELGNSLLPYRDQLQINFDPGVDESSIKVLKGLARLAERAIQNYQEAKQKNGVLDFSDLELYAARLLENPTILQTLQNQIRYILVDEFQDTNQFQWNLVKLLAMKPNTGQLTEDKLLIVGDEKQSIYSFRGGDVEVCDMAKEELLTCNLRNLDFGFRISELKTNDALLANGIIGFDVNFRSRPNLLYFFNRFFRYLLTKAERYEAEPQDLCYKQGDAFVFPENPIEMTEQGTVERFITYLPKRGRGSDLDEEEGIADDLKEAMMIAARLRVIMDGEMAEKYGDLGDKLHRRDKAVGILFRRRTKQKLYEEALRTYGVPYVVAKGRGFYEQQEILDIANVLRVLTDPRQDIALIGVLRSPLIGCSDNTLFQLRGQEGKEARRQGGKIDNYSLPSCPLNDFSEQDAQALRKARALFDEWSRLKNHISISELIVRIVRDTGAMMTYSRGSDGVQTVSNVEKLIDMARKFESQGFYTLADFTEYLQDQIEAEEEEGEADLPEGGGVQLMTVHQAKGLQFPMVIVPDTDAYFRYDEGMLIGKINGQTEVGLRMTKPDGDEADTAIRQILRAENRKKTIAEQKRLLYVAFTRAENHLIICQKIVEDSQPKVARNEAITKANCWGDWIRCILEGDEFSFVEDTVYSTELFSEEITRKKANVFENAEAVDFDPTLLYPEFIDPLKTVVTVSQKIQSGEEARWQDGKMARGQNGEESSYSGLHAAEIGILVHRILSQNHDLRYHQAIQLSQRVRAEAFLEGWTPTERNIQTVVKEILNTQKWIDTQAIDPNRRYRNLEFEYEPTTPLPPFFKGDENETIRGSIDLLYYDTELPGWVIVDFKTDRIPSEDMIETTIEERGYKQQMDYYCQAAETILSEHIQEKILFFTKFEKAYLFFSF
jgi:ATP-dependent helicase/nuclease subunit A